MTNLSENALLQLFEQYGMSVPIGGNNTVVFHNDEYVWYVKSGYIDLFCAPWANDEIIDKRTYCFRMERDSVLLGFHTDLGSALPVRMLMTGLPGTRLIRLESSRFKEWLLQPEAIDEAAAVIDRWISAWSHALKRGLAPSVYTALDESGPIAVKAGQAVRPARKVEWVQSRDSELHFMGARGPQPIPAGARFPVAFGGWLVTEDDTQLSALPTTQWLAQGDLWSDLDRFHGAVRDFVQIKLTDEKTSEWDRLRQKSDNDRKFMNHALERIMNVTQAEARKQPPLLGAGYSTLFEACERVGEALGVRMSPYAADEDQAADPNRDHVADIARASRVRTRKVMLKEDWWTKDSGPLLAFTEDGEHPVALLPKGPSAYECYDPETGEHKTVNAETAAALKPLAYMFYRPLPAHGLKVKDIFKFGAHRSIVRDGITAMLMGIAGGLLGMVIPIATGILYDTIIPESARGQIVQMAVLLVVVSCSIFMFELTRGFAMQRIEGKMNSSIQAAVWDRLMSLPVPFFRNYTAGDLAMRANSINAIRQALSGVAVTTIFSGIFSCFNFFLLFYYDVKLAFIAFGLVVVSIIATVVLSILQVRNQRVLMAIQGRISGFVLQIIGGIAKFRVAGAERRAFYLWANLFSEQRRTAFKARQLANHMTIFNTVFPIAASMVLFYAVVSSASGGAGGLSAGKFLAFFAAYSSFMAAMMSVSGSLISIINIIPMYERAKPILETLPEVDEAKKSPGVLSGAIEVSRLSFRYRADQPMILQDISLSINPGEFVALVGSSGCGKSTLFRLLLGFEQPEAGSVYYNGQDLKEIDVRELRTQLGVVLQNSKIMSGDLLTNIIGSANLSIDDAWEAARMAGLDEDIRQMPMGMHTVVADGGGTLSGGQRQRVLIARAMARKPKVMFFDEATSALDNRTQAIVSESLEKLQVTRVVIAHRLSTIMNADRIFVMDKGVVVESGSYLELLQQNGLFAQLAARQLA